jgi:hypothetical protein
LIEIFVWTNLIVKFVSSKNECLSLFWVRRRGNIMKKWMDIDVLFGLVLSPTFDPIC